MSGTDRWPVDAAAVAVAFRMTVAACVPSRRRLRRRPASGSHGGREVGQFARDGPPSAVSTVRSPASGLALSHATGREGRSPHSSRFAQSLLGHPPQEGVPVHLPAFREVTSYRIQAFPRKADKDLLSFPG